MRKACDIVHRLCNAGSVLCLTGMASCIVVQVFARFFLASAPSWTEEVSRMFFVYAIAFGGSEGVRSGAFIRLEVLQRHLGLRRFERLQAVIHGIIAIVCALVAVKAVYFVRLGTVERAPATEWPMAYVFASMVILFAVLSLFNAEQALHFWRNTKPTPS